MSTPELLPCPFCGGKNLSVEFADEDGEYASVWCADCKANGPIAFVDDGGSEDHAESKVGIERWQNRSAPQPAPTEAREQIYLRGLEGTRAIIETQEKVDVKEYERVVLALIDLYQLRSSGDSDR